MALEGNMQSIYGVEASYHNISKFEWNKVGDLNITVNSFFNEAARLDDKYPIFDAIYKFSNVLQNNGITFAELYGLLKTLDTFSSMVDA